ncbi:uncharacterized protein LOC123528942 [Mercenaria mercenaria]|uniref:uncharacterized protein LOC123528942 n=1 Tax=Mercenaria mercenaria TaxID=6596 RepID=UPI00234F99CE|nr:uncharacterized protein LOC123528942 [Mercenaria mercenaria]
MAEVGHDEGEENAGYILYKRVPKGKEATLRNDGRKPLQDLNNIVPRIRNLAVNEKHCEPPKTHAEPEKPSYKDVTTKKKRWSSGNLEEFLSFHPTERPVWREATIAGDINSIPSISEMIKDIVCYVKTYKKLKKTTGKTDRKQINKYLLTKFLCNVQKEEDIGVKEEGKTEEIMHILDKEYNIDEAAANRKLPDCSAGMSEEKKLCVEDERNESPEFDTYPSLEEELGDYHGRISCSGDAKPSKSELETKNLYKAYKHIVNELNESKTETDMYAVDSNSTEAIDDCKGVIEVNSLIIYTHRILMQGVMKEDQMPGRFSTNDRKANFKGKEYWYPTFEDEIFANVAVQTLVDKVNDIMDNIKRKDVSEEEKAKLFFKCSSLFLFVFLTLHPFADGNGRLARFLASYNLLTFSPFMTPVYNVFSSSRECDYIQALVDTREGLQIPKKVTAKDEAINLTISVMRQKPCDLCSMLIESNWTIWRQLLVKLGDTSIKLFEWEVQNQQFLWRTFEASESVQ